MGGGWMTRSDVKRDNFDGKVGTGKGRRGLIFAHESNDIDARLLSEEWTKGVWGRGGNGGLCSRLSKTEKLLSSCVVFGSS